MKKTCFSAISAVPKGCLVLLVWYLGVSQSLGDLGRTGLTRRRKSFPEFQQADEARTHIFNPWQASRLKGRGGAKNDADAETALSPPKTGRISFS